MVVIFAFMFLKNFLVGALYKDSQPLLYEFSDYVSLLKREVKVKEKMKVKMKVNVKVKVMMKVKLKLKLKVVECTTTVDCSVRV